MRKFIVAAVMAIGLIALWAAILPLTAQPAPKHTAVTPSSVSKALFLCRGPNGVDQVCAAALAKALVLEASTDRQGEAGESMCRADPQALAGLNGRG
jgi:hypothetical protein